MSDLIDAMARFNVNPTAEMQSQLEGLIPRRVRRHWDLSPPPGFPDPVGSDCPADFAGDAIFHAACAMTDELAPDSGVVHFALDSAVESIARLLAERDRTDENARDYRAEAANYIRDKIKSKLESQSAA
jgi:hypothetical protein